MASLAGLSPRYLVFDDEEACKIATLNVCLS